MRCEHEPRCGVRRPCHDTGVSGWMFDPDGPRFDGLSDPQVLASRALGTPRTPGMYVITCGGCLAHVGVSKNLATRIGQLARLGTHRGAAEVLCAAFCAGEPPVVRWESAADEPSARVREAMFKAHDGEPPSPRTHFADCVHGARLCARMIAAAGNESYEAGYIQAVFDIGEDLARLFSPRFESVWRQVGVPPGPWGAGAFSADDASRS